MQQSSAIFANVLVAYLLYITLKGELPAYLTLLRGGGQQATTSNSGTGSTATNVVTQGAAAYLNNNPIVSNAPTGSTNYTPAQAANAIDSLYGSGYH